MKLNPVASRNLDIICQGDFYIDYTAGGIGADARPLPSAYEVIVYSDTGRIADPLNLTSTSNLTESGELSVLHLAESPEGFLSKSRIEGKPSKQAEQNIFFTLKAWNNRQIQKRAS